jgi:hypothetical protein
MVMAMQQEGARARGPNGEIAVFRGGQWVVEPQGNSGWQLQRLPNPAEERAQQDQAWQAEDRARRAESEQLRLQLAQSASDRADRAAARAENPYMAQFQAVRGRADAERYAGALDGMRSASGLMSDGNRAISLLDAGAPTGPFAGARIMTGRTLGGVLGFLPGIPTPEQTQQLEQIRRIGDQGALGDVGQLKGPLSEKELGFIQRLQIDADTSPETNRVVAEAMRWTARRQAAYGAAMERWVNELGSPSATNADGLSFDRWWSQYASRALPRPGTPEAEALAAWQRENPGREAAVVPASQAQGPTQRDAASGATVSTRGVYNPQTGEIEWQ